MPRRLESGHNLPIALIIHEHRKYPVIPGTVQISVSRTGEKPLLFKFETYSENEILHPFQDQLRVFLFTIPRAQLPDGEILVNATLSITKKNHTKIILNDNLFSSSKLPFSCTITSNPLPGADYCTYGDLHTHSIYSQSHVEFGPPLQVIDRFAKVSGLGFVGITDHSYDLACRVDNYLVQDQSLKRWQMLSDEFTKPFETIMLKGEEISCLNKKGKVVHLGAIDHKSFLPGTLDGARKNICFPTQITINQAVNTIETEGGLSFAAHPGSESGILQSLFLHRGNWSEQDIPENLDGFQILNSGFKKSWFRGKELWIKMLQKSRRLPLLAGNDAHGDFNRYRAIGKPFLEIYEDLNRYMGFGKTGIYGPQTSQEQIKNQIKNGATFVTTGPYVSINFSRDPQSFAISKVTIDRAVSQLFLHAISTEEFGRILKVTMIGCGAENVEKPIFSKIYNESIYEVTEGFDVGGVDRKYVRAEIVCVREDMRRCEAYSSCCFF
ncbi:MAG: hypothetical protein GX640_09335 [Fibrobacter sp.]|nr:hypothetical protein [Fibrobacter sp.]